MRSGVILVEPTNSSDIDGRVRDAVERVGSAVDDVVVSCPAGRAEAVEAQLDGLGYRLATDRVPDGGHVAAMRSGCRVARGRQTCVTTPAAPIHPELLSTLFEAADRDGAVARIGGHERPLLAVYDTEAAIEAAETTLGMGSRAMTQVLERLDVATVAEPSLARGSEDAERPT